MKYRDLVRRLRSLGCEEVPTRSRGSHRRWTNPATGCSTSIPDHGPRDLKAGTLAAVLRQLGIDREDFDSAE